MKNRKDESSFSAPPADDVVDPFCYNYVKHLTTLDKIKVGACE